MILKIMGLFLVISSATLIGVFMGAKGTFRIMDLREFKKAFIVLKSEIEYLNSPLCEALENVSYKIKSPVSIIFLEVSKKLETSNNEEIYYIWQNAVLSHIKKTYLKDDDIDYIVSFGKCLGHIDKKLQINNINITINQIEERIYFLNEEVMKNKKMFNSLGVLGGILICILFI